MFHHLLKGSEIHIARSATGEGSPIGQIIPSIAGELFFQSSTGNLWVASATGDINAWSNVTPGGFVDSSQFTNVLSILDDDDQKAFETIDKVIDDTAITETRKTWSANKLSTTISNIFTNKTEFTVVQSSVGFSVLTPVYFNTDTNLWTKAQANSEDTLATHVISNIINASSFKLCQVGQLVATAHGKAEGYWFTSDVTAGETIDTSPVLSNPVFFVEDANTVHVLDYRPQSTAVPVVDLTIAHTDTQNTFLQTQKYNGDKTFTLDSELIAKKYADDIVAPKANDSGVVHNTGVETIDGVKTFNSFPITPSGAPTTSYQIANKKYVDDAVSVENLFNRVGTTLYPSTSDDNLNIGSGTIVSSKISLNEVDLSTTLVNPVYGEGKVFYDMGRNALSYYNDQSDVTVNLGQEVLIQVRNETGVTIPNGAVVYPTGFNNDEVLIGLALASDKEKCRLIGMTTHAIEDQTNGYVTKIGEVHDLNTSAYSSGDVVYLSPTVLGGITKVKPLTSNYITRIGAIKISDVSVGSIVVDTQTSEYTVEAVEDTGWSKTNLPTLSFTDGILETSRYLTITPASVNFCFYQYGDKYCKTTDSIRLPDTEGLYYIYYNLGVLSYLLAPTNSQIDVIIKNNPTVAYLYWDATNKKHQYFGYELHKIGMASDTHSYLHFVLRCRYLNGIEPSSIVADGNGDLDASAQFGIGGGAITDEDIYHATPTIGSTVGLPIRYLSGTSASPTLRDANNPGFSVATTGTGRLAFNSIVGGNWVLSEVANGNFVCCHVVAVNSNDIGQRVGTFIGQAEYTTVANARAGAQTELSNLTLTGIIPQESKAIATFIFETKATFLNTVKARIRSISTGVNFVDFRNVQIAGVAGGSATTTVFSDDQFKIFDGTDPTKVLTFQVSAITTANTRSITIPDRDLILNDIRATTTTNFGSGTIPYSNGTNIVTSSNLKFDFNNNRLILGGIVEYADNAAAVTAGLVVGSFYRTVDILKIVH